tara:strand:- start:1381 stop:1587 length:207 start_codon:yes stop_codon:yes gene_type:complete
LRRKRSASACFASSRLTLFSSRLTLFSSQVRNASLRQVTVGGAASIGTALRTIINDAVRIAQLHEDHK